eukprot:362655-Chlamydomonas_euryale.AAC.6
MWNMPVKLVSMRLHAHTPMWKQNVSVWKRTGNVDVPSHVRMRKQNVGVFNTKLESASLSHSWVLPVWLTAGFCHCAPAWVGAGGLAVLQPGLTPGWEFEGLQCCSLGQRLGGGWRACSVAAWVNAWVGAGGLSVLQHSRPVHTY